MNNGSNGALVSGNRAVGNGSAGIAVGGLRSARVLTNTSTGNGDDGLFLFDLQDSLVRGNHVSRNYTGIHLYGGSGGVAQFGGKRGPAHNRLVANTSTSNKYAGIWVKGDNRNFEVEHNRSPATRQTATVGQGGSSSREASLQTACKATPRTRTQVTASLQCAVRSTVAVTARATTGAGPSASAFAAPEAWRARAGDCG